MYFILRLFSLTNKILKWLETFLSILYIKLKVCVCVCAENSVYSRVPLERTRHKAELMCVE